MAYDATHWRKMKANCPVMPKRIGARSARTSIVPDAVDTALHSKELAAVRVYIMIAIVDDKGMQPCPWNEREPWPRCDSGGPPGTLIMKKIWRDRSNLGLRKLDNGLSPMRQD
jgi:hypothetical protein